MKDKMFIILPLCDHLWFTLIHGPNIPGSYAILFFTASEFTFKLIGKFHLWGILIKIETSAVNFWFIKKHLHGF